MLIIMLEEGAFEHMEISDSNLILKNGDKVSSSYKIEAPFAEIIRSLAQCSSTTILIFPKWSVCLGDEKTIKCMPDDDKKAISVIRASAKNARCEIYTGAIISAEYNLKKSSSSKGIICATLCLSSAELVIEDKETGKVYRWRSKDENEGFDPSYEGLAYEYWAYVPALKLT